MPCKACIERGKPWNGTDPKCAFEDALFNADNWNCATVGKIRDIAELEDISDVHLVNLENDERYSTINVCQIPGVGEAMTLWVQWYKRRGRTQAMWLLFERDAPRRPTEAECLAIYNSYAKQYPERFQTSKERE